MEKDSPVSKTFGGKKYVFVANHKTKLTANKEAEHWREHEVPARVWKNPESKEYIVYIMAKKQYKKTSERKLKRDWGVKKKSPLDFGKLDW